jgi:hypothetical protein
MKLIGILVMLTGIGFLSVLTATVASHFVQSDTEEEEREVLDTLRRIEAELTQLRAEIVGQRPTTDG